MGTQKHKTVKDFNGHLENHYLCPACNEFVSGRVSWSQAGKQKHFKCLTLCNNPSGNACEHAEPDRVKGKILCEKIYKCKYKTLKGGAICLK